jgi:ABC-type lipoprotein export system ATPase subunit
MKQSESDPHPNPAVHDALVRVHRVCKSFGSQEVLCGVDFEIRAAERIALMGPSGSGKSTLLNILSGIDRPDSGRIWFDGTELSKLDPDGLAGLRRTSVSTVFQFFHLLPTLTAYENVELGLQLNHMPPAKRRARVGELLDAVQLSGHTDALPETLSGGERQRVAIARALAIRPRLLLADEPTGSLDSRTGDAILDLMQALTIRYDTALLLVTHSSSAARICSRTLHINDGRIE